MGDIEQISSEDIKHLIFRSEPEEKKFPMYRSKFSGQVRKEAKMGKECHKTMGLPEDFPPINPASNFLKKHTRMVVRPVVEVPKPPAGPLSSVPHRNEWNRTPHRVMPNFVSNNMRRVINAVPKTGPSRAVDSKGLRFHNCNLLMPKFIHKEGFGKVPRYLQHVKQEQQKLREAVEEEIRKREEEEAKRRPGLIAISKEERQALLDGLKGAWASLQKEFQLLPMLNDTPPKIKHKRALEQELAMIEKEIQMIEEHQKIYVYNCDENTMKDNEVVKK